MLESFCLSSRRTSGHKAQHGERETLGVRVACRVRESLLAGVSGEGHAVGVAQFQVVA